MSAVEDSTAAEGVVKSGAPSLVNMAPVGVAFAPSDLTARDNLTMENNIFTGVLSRIRLQPGIYGLGAPIDAAATTLTQELFGQMPQGVEPRTQDYVFLQRAFFPPDQSTAVVLVGWSKPMLLDRYAPGDAPGVWEKATGQSNVRNVVNSLNSSEPLDEYTLRQFAAALDTGLEIHDLQGFLLPFITAAKLLWDLERVGLPPLPAVAAANNVNNWAAVSLGHYSAAEMNAANGGVNITVADFRNAQSNGMTHALINGSIPLQADCFTVQEKLNINSIVSGGLLMVPVAGQGYSIAQLFKFMPISIVWWSSKEALLIDPTHAGNAAQPAPQCSGWWTALAHKLALHLAATGSLVRAYMRLTCMITGERRTTPTGIGGANQVETSYWVMAMQEIRLTVPQPRGSSFVAQLFGTQRAPHVDNLFERDYRTLTGLGGRGEDLYISLLSVGVCMATAFSTTLNHFNVTGRELGNAVITTQAWTTARRPYNELLGPFFRGDRAGFCQIINQACTMLSVFTHSTVNVLCFSNEKGWCDGLVGVERSDRQASYWNLWFGGRVPYLAHPFVMHHVLRAYSAEWGITAPNSEFDFSAYWYRDEAAWVFDTSRPGPHGTKSQSEERYTLVCEGGLAINAACQRSTWNAGHSQLRIGWRYWDAATGAPQHPGGATPPALMDMHVGGGLQLFFPGVLLSWDWNTMRVVAPMVPQSGFGGANFATLRASTKRSERFVGVVV